MLIIEGLYVTSAINWDSIESVNLDRSELPDCQLRITTKSGLIITVLNPNDSVGLVNFDVLIDMWSKGESSLRIKETQSTKKPCVGLPMNPWV